MLEHSCKNDVDPTGGIIAPEKFSETGILSEAPLALHTQKNHFTHSALSAYSQTHTVFIALLSPAVPLISLSLLCTIWCSYTISL